MVNAGGFLPRDLAVATVAEQTTVRTWHSDLPARAPARSWSEALRSPLQKRPPSPSRPPASKLTLAQYRDYSRERVLVSAATGHALARPVWWIGQARAFPGRPAPAERLPRVLASVTDRGEAGRPDCSRTSPLAARSAPEPTADGLP